jgi:cytochrome c oxidase subunit IV
MAGKIGTPVQLLLTWIAMLALLAVSVATVYLPLGGYATWIQFAVAAMIIGLLVYFWMQLRTGTTAVRVAALVGAFFLFVLTFLSFNDYLTRHWDLAAYQTEPAVAAPLSP